jgi:glycyl-tRNA synthetase (class II)
MTAYDDVASIGRQYRRRDDWDAVLRDCGFDSLEDKKVTVGQGYHEGEN